jgi:Ca-activated chloride channel homolog
LETLLSCKGDNVPTRKFRPFAKGPRRGTVRKGATVRIRHKSPTGEKAIESAFPMIGGPAASFANSPADFRFAFAVAAFADLLRGGEDAEHWSLGEIRKVAANATGEDTDRQELITLIDKAIAIKGRSASR